MLRVSKIPVYVSETSKLRGGDVVYFVLLCPECQQEYGRGVNRLTYISGLASSSANFGITGNEMLSSLIGRVFSKVAKQAFNSEIRTHESAA
jgi:hypothetical protein